MTQRQTVDKKQVEDLLDRQRKVWPLLGDNYRAWEQIRQKKMSVKGLDIQVQFNPSRIVSSAAETDARSIRERRCFLCLHHLPPEQEYMLFGDDYLILCNPFPLFPHHLTVPACEHTGQSIMTRLKDLLELSRSLEAFTIFYNGPKSGASAPDHMHFQVVTRFVMPIDHLTVSPCSLVCRRGTTSLYVLTGYLRNGFIILSDSPEEIRILFMQLIRKLEIPPGETEPMMNVFCNYQDNRWTVKIIPRKKHRPSHYFAEGEERILASPGAADIGGTFITSREEDFRKITPSLLRDIYEQVCFSDKEVEKVVSYM